MNIAVLAIGVVFVQPRGVCVFRGVEQVVCGLNGSG